MPKRKPKPGVTLTPLEDRFVEEYMVDLKADRAYQRASPTSKWTTARTEGTQMRNRPHVDAAIAARTAELRAKLAVTRENVLAEYAKIAFSSLDEAAIRDRAGRITGFDISRIPASQLAVIKEVEFEGTAKKRRVAKVRMHDKVAALHKLGAHLRLFADDEAQPFTNVVFNVIRTRERVPPKRRPPMEK